MLTEERYIAKFELLEKSLNGLKGTPIHDIKLEARKNFIELGLPTSKLESWKYTNLSKLWKSGLETVIHNTDRVNETTTKEQFEGLKANRLCFIDGVFSENQSTIIDNFDGLEISSLNKAFRNKEKQVLDYFGNLTSIEAESLTNLNTALSQDGAYINVPVNYKPAHPILITYNFTNQSDGYIVQPRNLIILNNGAEVTIIENYQNQSSKNILVNKVAEIFIGDNAGLEHYQCQIDQKDINFVNSQFVKQEKDSRFKSYTINFGGSLTRNNINVTLNGEMADASLYGFYDLNGDDHVDNHLFIDHSVPNCTSNQFFKGLMDGKSTGIFNGKVLVRPDAQKTNAFQSNKNILLSKQATINSKPELEIYADDVKCSHGSSTGQLDKTALFYLTSRGIGRDKATALLNQAFIAEIIELIPNEYLKAYLLEELAKHYKLEF